MDSYVKYGYWRWTVESCGRNGRICYSKLIMNVEIAVLSALLKGCQASCLQSAFHILKSLGAGPEVNFQSMSCKWLNCIWKIISSNWFTCKSFTLYLNIFRESWSRGRQEHCSLARKKKYLLSVVGRTPNIHGGTRHSAKDQYYDCKWRQSILSSFLIGRALQIQCTNLKPTCRPTVKSIWKHLGAHLFLIGLLQAGV